MVVCLGEHRVCNRSDHSCGASGGDLELVGVGGGGRAAVAAAAAESVFTKLAT